MAIHPFKSGRVFPSKPPTMFCHHITEKSKKKKSASFLTTAIGQQQFISSTISVRLHPTTIYWALDLPGPGKTITQSFKNTIITECENNFTDDIRWFCFSSDTDRSGGSKIWKPAQAIWGRNHVIRSEVEQICANTPSPVNIVVFSREFSQQQI